MPAADKETSRRPPSEVEASQASTGDLPPGSKPLANSPRSVERKTALGLRTLIGTLLALIVGVTAAIELAGAPHPAEDRLGQSDNPASRGGAPLYAESNTGGGFSVFPDLGDQVIAAQAATDTVAVFDSPLSLEPKALLPRNNEHSVVQTFLVKSFEPGWAEVALPTPPNGSRGWIRLSEIELFSVPYEIRVHLASHRLEVWARGSLEMSFPIAVGRKNTPTPQGEYYIKELLRPADPSGPWGTYAYGLNGYTNEVTLEEGKPGVIGIHGTDDPSSIGQEVSAGCIRMRNSDIELLVPKIPLGTPVKILDD